ncbi:hypothetical protein CPB84DRAFT_1788251 [Gymnopilus junonius]|uniref:Uncharacterized protein n=1 Tax=Gymnopilus junonius TaxID=109634 RepID=A0A9P5NIK1_GYMJU|nr:hypothetical protein CPB84DRAFT_1788251 [Gymnopilus junonius]
MCLPWDDPIPISVDTTVLSTSIVGAPMAASSSTITSSTPTNTTSTLYSTTSTSSSKIVTVFRKTTTPSSKTIALFSTTSSSASRPSKSTPSSHSVTFTETQTSTGTSTMISTLTVASKIPNTVSATSNLAHIRVIAILSMVIPMCVICVIGFFVLRRRRRRNEQQPTSGLVPIQHTPERIDPFPSPSSGEVHPTSIANILEKGIPLVRSSSQNRYPSPIPPVTIPAANVNIESLEERLNALERLILNNTSPDEVATRTAREHLIAFRNDLPVRAANDVEAPPDYSHWMIVMPSVHRTDVVEVYHLTPKRPANNLC